MKHPAVVLLVLLVSVGCASSDGSDEQSSASSELSDATEATLALDGLRIEVETDGYPSSTFEYQAPDKIRIFYAGDEGLVAIGIGDSTWLSVPDRKGYYTKGPVGLVDSSLFPLTMARSANEVSKDEDGTFTFTVEQRGASVEGTAMVADGLVTLMTLHVEIPGQQEDLIYRVSDVIPDPPIHAPPAGRVIKQPDTSKCPDESGSFVGSEPCLTEITLGS